jgi:hypothetical protein
MEAKKSLAKHDTGFRSILLSFVAICALSGCLNRSIDPEVQRVPGALVLHEGHTEILPDVVFLKETEGMKLGMDKDAERVILRRGNGTVVLLETKSGRIIKELQPSSRWGNVFQAAFSPTAPLIALSFQRPDQFREHDLLWIWNYQTGTVEAVTATDDEGASELRYSPDGSKLAYRHGRSNVDHLTIKDVASGRSVDLAASLFGLCFSADSRMVSDGATVWNLIDFPQIKSTPVGTIRAFDPSGQKAYGFVDPIRPYSGEIQNRDALVSVYATSTWNKIGTWDLPRAHYDLSGYADMSVTRDSRYLLISSEQGIGVWEVRNHKEVGFLKGQFVKDIQLLPDGRHVAAISAEGILLWSLP